MPTRSLVHSWHCAWSSDLVINDSVNGKTYWDYLGGRMIYSFNADPLVSDPHYRDGSRVQIVRDGGNNVIGGRVYRSDGAILEYFQVYSATRFLLTSLIDPDGKALIFSYDVYGRLNQITTATGETVSFV